MASINKSGRHAWIGELGDEQADRLFQTAVTTADVAQRVGMSLAELVELRRMRPPGQPQIADLARRLGVDRGVLASLFHCLWTRGLCWAAGTYRQRYALSTADLARYLLMPESKVAVLYHNPCPDPGDKDYGHEVVQLAERAGCSAERLGAVLADIARLEAQPEPAGALPSTMPWATES